MQIFVPLAAVNSVNNAAKLNKKSRLCKKIDKKNRKLSKISCFIYLKKKFQPMNFIINQGLLVVF